MGTRSLTVLQDYEGNEIAVLYRQMDGYPSVHGADLKAFLSDMVITNGLVRGKTANGAECLAAQVIAHFKDGAGGFYLLPAGARDWSEEYIYHIRPEKPVFGPPKMNPEPPRVKVTVIEVGWNAPDKTLFEGYISDMPTTDPSYD